MWETVRDAMETVGINRPIPKEHLLRKINDAADFDRLYEMVELLYSESNRRPGIDPVVLIKMVLIRHV